MLNEILEHKIYRQTAVAKHTRIQTNKPSLPPTPHPSLISLLLYSTFSRTKKIQKEKAGRHSSFVVGGFVKHSTPCFWNAAAAISSLARSTCLALYIPSTWIHREERKLGVLLRKLHLFLDPSSIIWIQGYMFHFIFFFAFSM